MSKCVLSVNGNRAMNYLLQTILKEEYDFLPVNDVFQAMQKLKTNRKKKLGKKKQTKELETEKNLKKAMEGSVAVGPVALSG